jgi:hypothetical protein
MQVNYPTQVVMYKYKKNYFTKLKASENDYISALRETEEEIGFNLGRDAFSLGRLPRNFFAYPSSDGRDTHIAVNVFLVPRRIIDNELKLQDKEV